MHQKTIIKQFFLIFLALILFIGITVPANGMEFVKKQITLNSRNAGFPAISGNYIVWLENRLGHRDVYMYDLSTDTETLITKDPHDHFYPNVSGNYIIWLDIRNGGYDVYGYDLVKKEEFRITNYTAPYTSINYYKPGIYGDKVVYYDSRSSGEYNWDIWMYNLTTGVETQITTDTGKQFNPVIYGDKIVWWDFRDYSMLNVYMFDLTTNTESRISNSEYHNFQGRTVSINGNYIVWDDERNGNPNIDIFSYNLLTGTESPVCTKSEMQHAPDVSGNYVVWTDYRLGEDHSAIYIYDIYTQTEYSVDTENSNPYGVDAWGANIDHGNIVYTKSEMDNGNIISNIYMVTIIESPSEQINSSFFNIVSLNLPRGTEKSLIKKLESALKRLTSEKRNAVSATCKKLNSFINKVQAISGKKIERSAGDQLIGDANKIKLDIGCSQ